MLLPPPSAALPEFEKESSRGSDVEEPVPAAAAAAAAAEEESATWVTEKMQMTTILSKSASPKAELDNRVRKSAIAVSKIDGKSSRSCSVEG